MKTRGRLTVDRRRDCLKSSSVLRRPRVLEQGMEQLEVVSVGFEVWLYLRCVLAGPVCRAVAAGGGKRQDREGGCESRLKSFGGGSWTPLRLAEGCEKVGGD